MDMRADHPGQGGRGPVLFRAVLHPNRSLSAKGFRRLMLAVGALSLTLGLGFFMAGAWPIVGFLGLDVLLVYLAFKASYRSGRLYETVELDADKLTVQRVDPARRVRTWTFQPTWLQVHIQEPVQHDSHVTLSSHGRQLVVGSFLAPEERLDFAQALRGALARWRRPDGLPGHPA